MIRIQKFSTPIKLQWRRITFICGITIGLLLWSSCGDFIPDHDACQDIYVSKNESNITIDSSIVYDTLLSTLKIENKSTSNLNDLNVNLFMDKKIIDKSLLRNKSCDFKWVGKGNYSIQIGNTAQFPCLNIYDIAISNGKGYILIIH